MADVDAMQLANIRITPLGIAVIDGKRTMLEVSAPEVQSIELRRGVPSHRPVATAIVGMLLFGLALVPIPMLIGALLGRAAFRPSLVAVVGFGIPAWHLVRESVIAQYLLLVKTSGGAKKFPVGSEEMGEIQAFLANAKARFPWLESKV